MTEIRFIPRWDDPLGSSAPLPDPRAQAQAIQGARHFKDICWNDMISVGDVNLRPEFEHSTYYLDVADVDLALRYGPVIEPA